VEALRDAYCSAAAMDAERGRVEAAIAASRPEKDRVAAAAGPGKARDSLWRIVAARFRGLRNDAFPAPAPEAAAPA